MAEERQVPLPGLEGLVDHAPTEPTLAVGQGDKPGFHVRMFGSSQFFHLWLTQVASATGDWLGFLAIAIIAMLAATRTFGRDVRAKGGGASRASL